MLDTLLLIVRWAGALFLFLMAVMFPTEFWKRREPGAQGLLLMAVGIALAGITATAGVGLISWNWQPLWLAFRCAVALLLVALAVALQNQPKKEPDHGLLHRTLFLLLGGVFAATATSVVTLDWRWLLASLGFVVLSFALMISGRLVNTRKASKAMQELAVKTRGTPLRDDEITQRMKHGEYAVLGVAMEEMRLGRALTAEEVEAFATEQKEAFSRLDAEARKEEEQRQQEERADEAAAEALRLEMQTGKPGARRVTITLDRELTIEGDDGSILVLPSGPHALWLRMQLEAPEEESDGYPAVQIEFWKDGDTPVMQTIGLTEIADMSTVQRASLWRSKDADWRKSFCESVLLEPTECAEDDKAWMEFPVDTDRLAFYSRSGGKSVTLACPAPGDGLWCRVHGLSYLEQEEDGDWRVVEPFCFPLSIERLSQSEPHETEGDEEQVL
jgi:hypothetical protein